MSEDFFKGIDAQLNKQKAAKTASEVASDKNREFAKALIPQLAAIADGYADQCKERGIDASVKTHEFSISVTLRYKGGVERSLVGSPQYDRDYRFSFEEFFPDNNGKRYKTAPMQWYDESNWSNDTFEAKVKKLITDHIFYADRFGGI
ncbi:hypothetical protein [Sphingobium yanoikuyae]|uniref:Uncharacterized protein n=1 Tax=Sphingobium yanoikuyae TaxID=13690 RepID=A0A0J9CSQ2_SPHYA|nr:hypothetical protein [Sphingobium yanoikuyae]ATP20470.1 hypothetical protein BV87_20200 [Sphingobium yanoikuyae]KMW28218.1 hypothetical protein BV87_23990 [Sphingobium yanoikuyae]